MAPSTRAQTLYLVDISSFIFRAFYAIRQLNNKTGEPTNAVYGVAQMMARLWDEAKPEHLVCVYDSKEPSFRKERYPEYKANRSAAPDELIPQFDRIEQLISAMEIPSVRKSGVEADDLIATLTLEWIAEAADHRVVIVTGDKDLMQLVSDRVQVWDTMAGKFFGPAEVEEKFGLPPTQIRDYLSLVGDSSDNIPGVEGVGPKTAVDLLKAHGDLLGVLAAAKAGKISGKRGTTIAQSEEVALLSQELVSLKGDLDFELSHDETNYSFKMSPELVALFRDLNFDSLIPKWEEKAKSLGQAPIEEAAPKVAASAVPFITIDEEAAFEELLVEVVKKGEFSFDLETTSLNPRAAKIVGIAICITTEKSYYIPIGHTSGKQLPADFVLGKLKPLLENARLKKIGQNLKYDWSVLMAHGWKPDGIGADTMVASYAVDPEGRHGMDLLAEKYLSYTTVKYEDVCGKGKDQISFADVAIDVATRYSAEDAWVALKLWEELRPKLQSEGLMPVFAQIDLPLVPVLADIEMTGVCIDEAWLAELSERFDKELKAIEERVHAFSPEPINLNSPKQVGHLLFEVLALPTQGKTKTGFSTDASVLEALSPLHEVPRLLLEFREIAKLKGTYVDPLPLLKDAKDGKIHASFHQAVAATGRLSSSDPNLQNIPIRTERGKLIRRAFLPSPGNVLLSADYSQIELRILAHMSGDPDLTDSFKKGEDVHRRTASEIYGVSPESVDDRQRSIAKAINFGLMYGKTAFGLAQELHIPRREAAEMIEKYFTRYRQVKQFLDQQVEDARERGWTTTLMGRRRYLREIRNKNPAIRANAERMAMNAPIQGTAADLMKVAMIEIAQSLKQMNLRSKLIVQVHDEVLLDCPKEEVEQVRRMVEKRMERAAEWSVPLSVNSGTGQNWMEL